MVTIEKTSNGFLVVIDNGDEQMGPEKYTFEEAETYSAAPEKQELEALKRALWKVTDGLGLYGSRYTYKINIEVVKGDKNESNQEDGEN